MIIFKSPHQITQMRVAGKLVAKAHQMVRRILKPGITTLEIDAAIEALFEEHSATSLFKGVPGKVPFPSVTCISVNDQVVHGIPGDRVICEGDLVSVDTGCRLNGWCGDAAWTYAVGDVDEERDRLLRVGEDVLNIAIRELGRQPTWSAVARLMERAVRQAGFHVVQHFVGHGIGREMHEDPQVPNFVSPELGKHDFQLQPGLVLAIEPMVNAGTQDVRLLDDHWTVATADRRPSVHFEHTVALTEAGPCVLTAGEEEDT